MIRILSCCLSLAYLVSCLLLGGPETLLTVLWVGTYPSPQTPEAVAKSGSFSCGSGSIQRFTNLTQALFLEKIEAFYFLKNKLAGTNQKEFYG